MGFDVVLYSRNKEQIGFFEIPEAVHEAIFQSNTYWRSYVLLRKMNDYYATNVKFTAEEIAVLAKELQSMKLFIAARFHVEIDQIILRMSEPSVALAHIAGD
ncbi:hypothetical protein [Paenibacillus sp. NEAU-GSW1]|uniref:hypothetical protein n=1 Tax=Paenibacillus sp. NEAU-GSW1 TaxID=2682486 RepID=UPI0012E1F145|nr:hypothetical protein [Paenibacillus sp. NEAU-GSW1]MUT64814.1 hypothetical protein [Paenibacillus sp. NEAU-GSW1]